MLTEYNPGAQSGASAAPYRVALGPMAILKSTSVGTWIRTGATSAWTNSIRANSPAAQNDAADFDVVLSAGTWTIDVIIAKVAAGGTAKVQLDDGNGTFTTIATIDSYAASTAYNVSTATAAVAVATSGRKTLRLLIDTKNASSSGYQLNIEQIELVRTA